MSFQDQIGQIKGLLEKAKVARERATQLVEKHAREIMDYETAIAVLAKLAPLETQNEATAAAKPAASSGYSSGSIASRILHLLKASEKTWWTANEIQSALANTGEPVKMTSVSPNLTRLKESGDIVRDDFKVALRDRVHQKTEASEGDLLHRNPSEASNDTRPYQSGEPPAQGREAVPGGGP